MSHVQQQVESLCTTFNNTLKYFGGIFDASENARNVSAKIEDCVQCDDREIDIIIEFKIRAKTSSLSKIEPNKNGDKMATELILVQDLQTSGSSSSDSPNSVQSTNNSQNSRSRSPRSPIKSHLKNQSEKKLNSPARKLFGKSFHCSKCPRKFTWEKSLVRHLKNKHKQREIHKASIIDMPEI